MSSLTSWIVKMDIYERMRKGGTCLVDWSFPTSGNEFEELEDLKLDVMKQVIHVRRLYDQRVADIYEKHPGFVEERTGLRYNRYPTGWWKPISDFVFDVSMHPDNNQLMYQLSQNGHIAKRIFGIWNEEFFHNIIQVGHLMIDAAGDTVDSDKNPFGLFDFDKIHFKEISNYKQLFSVYESYWNYDVVVNDMFPECAFTHPYLLIWDDAAIFCEMHTPLVNIEEMKNGYKETREILFGDFNVKRMTTNQRNDLEKRMRSSFEDAVQEKEFIKGKKEDLSIMVTPAKTPAEFQKRFEKQLEAIKNNPRHGYELFYQGGFFSSEHTMESTVSRLLQ